MTSNRIPTHLHIPTPGDHYSAATGSAIMTVIYELARCHASEGGHTQIVVGRGTRHDYPVGECLEVEFPVSITRRQKLLDSVLALAGAPRHYEAGIYRPALAAIPPEFDGVLFLHNAPGALPSFRAAFPRAQLCLYAHNALFGTYRAPEVRRVERSADRIICVSDFLAKDVNQRAGIVSSRVRAVNNGVDTDSFQPARPDASDAPISSSPPIVLFIGRVAPQKGAHLLIEAARQLVAEGVRLQLRIVGSSGFSAVAPLSPYEEELRKSAAPLGEAVQFQPFVDRTCIMDEYRQATIFCVPSDWDEPCTLTVPEGMACGLAIVASSRGGIPEVGGDAVLYFDPPDVETLTSHLRDLLHDSEVRAAWGRKARKRALEICWKNQYRKLCAALAAKE